MSTEVAVVEPGGRTVLSAAEMKVHVRRIQEVMRAVMKDGVHYGKIPGAGEKKTLFKPGAEVLCMAFHIAPSYRITDLSDSDCIRYRVVCVGTHQGTGVVLGEGLGEASSNEEKYKWRNAVCEEEFEETPEDRRRVKYQRSQNGVWKRMQVRTEPADIANTVLKMACKRAQVAMTINVTAASDIFTQDLEDMPEDLRASVAGEERHDPEQPQQRPQAKPQTQAPRASQNGNGGRMTGFCSERQVKLIAARLDDAGIPEKEFLDKFGIAAIGELPFGKVDDALRWIAAVAENA